jgi:hypothetical protein
MIKNNFAAPDLNQQGMFCGDDSTSCLSGEKPKWFGSQDLRETHLVALGNGD